MTATVGAPGSLRARALRGGAWLAAGNAFAKVANFVKRAILAHFLSPADFGLMGIALLMLSWLEYFTETGVRSALVQRRESIDGYLSTAWTLQVARSLVLGVGILVLAPGAASFFDAAGSIPVVRCIAVVVVLRGFTNPALVRLKRDLDFKLQTLWNLSGAVVGLIVGVTMALVRPDVWALVVSVIAGEATRTIASYVVVPFRPSWGFHRDRAQSLFAYGRWIFLFNVVAFLSLNLDSIAVGRLMSVEALGLYQMGYQFAFVLLRNGAMITSTVMFPALSRVDEPEKRTRAFFSILTVLAPVAILVAFSVSLFAEPLVSFLYGPKWIAAASVVAILTFAAACDALSKVVYPFFNASGSPQFSVATAGVKAVVLAVAVYPLIDWAGMRGAALALTLAELSTLVMSLVLVCRVTGRAWRDMLRPFGGAVMVALPWLAVLVVDPLHSIPGALLVVGTACWSIFVIGFIGRNQLKVTRTASRVETFGDGIPSSPADRLAGT